MPSHRPKVTPYEWRANTVAGMQQRKEQLETEIDALAAQIKDLNALIKPLLAAELTKPEPPTEDEIKPEPKSKKADSGKKSPPKKKRIAWQHRPENKAKVRAWKRAILKAQKRKKR